VLVYAHREDAPQHAFYRDWVADLVGAPEPFGVADLVLSGFLRIVTHSRVFTDPTPIDQAVVFCETLRSRPNAVVVAPGARHWRLFIDLCQGSAARGNLVPDAYFAALAIESGSTWATADRDYSRFPGLALAFLPGETP
jgi:toxin-antitoxin system PIN domain toxin